MSDGSLSSPQAQPGSPTGDDIRSLRHCCYLLIIAAASAMSFAQILQSQPLQSANDRSRWATVWSLVERGTYQIDEIDARPGWSTIDKVRHNGHFYSTKPPLQSTLVAGIYWLVKKVTGWDLLNQTTEVTRLILLFVNWLPRVISLIVVAMLVERNARRDFGKLFVLLVASWATLLGPFTSSLNNHLPAAICVVLAMYPLLRVLNDGEHRKRFFALVGFFSALTFCLELPAVLLVAIFGALLLKADARRTLTVFVPAVLVPIAVFSVTNSLVTGTPMPFYSSYGSDKYRFEHEGIPSYWSNPQGLDQNLDSPLMYALHCTIGHHGLFSLTPVWLLTLVGWFRWRRWPECRQRTMLLVGAGLTAVTLGFYLTRTQNYNYGGNSVGLRWMLWLVPLWLIAMIPAFDTWGSRRWFKLLSTGLLAVSIASAGLPGSNPWQHPWLFMLMQRWGWIDYDAPTPPFPFEHKLWTWFPKLEEKCESEGGFVTFAGSGSPVLWEDQSRSSTSVGRTMLTLSTSCERVDGPKGVKLFPVDFTWDEFWHDLDVDSVQTPPPPRYALTAFFEEAEFNVGKMPNEFLSGPNGHIAKPNDGARLRMRVTGLPSEKGTRFMPFRPGHIRYLKTPLRPEKAFRCQRAAAQTFFQPKHADRPLRYRCDVWLCDEIPFGVAQLELTVSDPPTGQTLMFQRLTAVEASGFPTRER